jgi:hypothetical protein
MKLTVADTPAARARTGMMVFMMKCVAVLSMWKKR